jgi:AraC family transcriptional regulator of adaptative response/methylated-DNA-[protein]-cysteine methyltransferase
MALSVPALIHSMKSYGDNKILASILSTRIGEMFVLETSGGICLLEFADRKGLEHEVQVILQKTKGILIEGGSNFFALLSEELGAYFQDCTSPFSVPLDLLGSEFQQQVWKTLIEIPVGQTRTYSQVAETIGKSKAVRAVGNANAKNPIAIVIPCHRLIGANGTLTGYGGGIWRKEWLLKHEKQATKSDKD